jgi:replicative DNA helicase
MQNHSLEAEQGVLGSILVDSQHVYRIKEVVKACEFFDHGHRNIFLAIDWCLSNGFAIDTLTVSSRLKDLNQLDGIGGRKYLSALSDHAALPLNALSYAGIIHQKYKLREMDRVLTELQTEVRTPGIDPELMFNMSISRILSIDGLDKSTYTMQEAGLVLLDEIYERQGKELYGITSGSPEIDKHTFGNPERSLIVIGATSGMGKSTICLSLMLAQARAGIPVLYCSLEMPPADLIAQLIPGFTNTVSYRDLKTNQMSESQLNELTSAIQEFNDLPIHFCFNKSNVDEILAITKQYQINKGVKSMFIDHLQSTDGAEDYVEYVKNTKKLKQFALKNKVCVQAISQYTTEYEQRANKEPNRSTFRGGKNLIQDCDVAIGFYKLDDDDDQVYGKLIKNRPGVNAKPYYFKVLYNEIKRTAELELCARPQKEEDAKRTRKPKQKQQDEDYSY